MGQTITFLPQTADSLAATGEKVPQYFQNFLHQYNVTGNQIAQGINGALVTGTNIAGMRFPTTGVNSYKTGPNYTNGVFAPIKFLWTAQQYKTPDHLQTTWTPQNGSIGTSPVGIPAGAFVYDASTNTITVNMVSGLANSTNYYYWFTVT